MGILDFLGHKVFNAGIATCILHVRYMPPLEGHLLVVDNVLDFEPVRAILESSDPLAQLPPEAVTRIEVSQSDLSGERWSLSPYRNIFDRIDLAGKQLNEGISVIF